MITRSLIWGAFATAAALSPAFAQDSTVRIVLNEEVDLLEPCMTTRSNIGRVTLQNVNETLAFLDLREGGGLQPKLGAAG